MATEVYFRGGGQVTLRDDLDAVTQAVVAAAGRPVPVEPYAGGRLALNWENVLYLEERGDLAATPN